MTCYSRSPLVKSRYITHGGSQFLQQVPWRATQTLERLPCREHELHVTHPRETDIAMRPIGYVHHKPIHAYQSRAVYV